MKDMYNKQGIIKVMALLGAVFGASSGLAAEEKARDPGSRPNIVLFLSDDHGWADSGVYDDSYIRTPNMDRLAKESMLFTHAFAGAPLCNPSRHVIASGLMPMRNGHHLQGGGRKRSVSKWVSMPAHMRNLGYHTARIGKQGCGGEYDFKARLGSYGSPNAEHEKHLSSFIRSYDKRQPLYPEVCPYQPHTPWIKNTEYDPAKITLPPNYVDTLETRQDRTNYYTDVTHMDHVLGDVLDALKSNGMDRNTLFAYTSDQGSNWPFAKWCVYDGGLRVPMLVRWPGIVKENTKTDAMIGLVDLLPTFVEAAGGTPPQGIDGKSFMQVLTGKKKKHRDFVFGTHSGSTNGPAEVHNLIPMRTVRTPTHRYILNLTPEVRFANHITGCKTTDPHYLAFWSSWVEKAQTDRRAKEIVHRYEHGPKEELYDLREDPFEMNNLAADPEQADLLKSLRKQLADWCKTQDDPMPLKHLTEK